jgi:hypothetical protein
MRAPRPDETEGMISVIIQNTLSYRPLSDVETKKPYTVLVVIPLAKQLLASGALYIRIFDGHVTAAKVRANSISSPYQKLNMQPCRSRHREEKEEIREGGEDRETKK